MLLVAAVLGAGAVSLSTSYAFGDSFGEKHSLHRTIRTAPVFYLAYGGQIVAASLVVLLAGSTLLGTLTQWVQVLAGILPPSAILFLVLLCNDKQILGPWVNRTWQNVVDFTIIGVLIVLSMILVMSTLFTAINAVLLTEDHHERIRVLAAGRQRRLLRRAVAVALVLGAAIGLERQWRQRTAGLRTNALVALGAALFELFAVLLSGARGVDPTRIAAYVVSGIGFLGAGVILRDGIHVRGINTAATVWCSAVGVLAVPGYLPAAAIAAALILTAHLALRPIGQRIGRRGQPGRPRSRPSTGSAR